MKDERAGVPTSDRTMRMTDSICVAADNPVIGEITATILTDSKDVLVELWAGGGVVVGHYIVTGKAAARLRKRVKPNARRQSIL